MSGSDANDDSPPPAADDLQPDADPPTSYLAEQAALDELHDCNGFTAAERAEALRGEERLSRLASDHAEVEKLRAAGFEGPGYETLKATLALYGFPVMQAWIRRHQIFSLTAGRGRPVQCRDAIREHLTRDRDDRQELSMDVVANALVFFRTHALINGKWSPAGGASLTTYFAGACVSVFPNVFRAWLKEFELDLHTGNYELDPDLNQNRRLLDPRLSADPADVVSNMEIFCAELQAASTPRLRHAIAEVVVNDAQYSEIATQVGSTEAAIKMMFFRHHRKRRTEEGKDS